MTAVEPPPAAPGAVSTGEIDALFRQLPVACGAYVGPELRVRYASPRLREVFGPERIRLGDPLAACVPELADAGIVARLEEVFRSGVPAVVPSTRVMLVRDGVPTEGFYSWEGRPLRDGEGRIEGVIAWGLDVTDAHRRVLDVSSALEELRLANDKVAASARELRALADLMPQLVFRLDAAGAVVTVNARFLTYTGAVGAEAVGIPWALLLHPEDRAVALACWADGAAEGAPIELEVRMRRHDGVFRWFLGRAEALRDARNEITGWVGTCTDIDDQRRAAEERDRLTREALAARAAAEVSAAKIRTLGEAVRSSEERLRMALEASGVGSYDVDTRTMTYVWDERCRALWGLPPGATVTRELVEACIHPDDRELVELSVPMTGPARSFVVECRVVGLVDGEQRWLRSVGRTHVDAAGAVVRVVGTVADITEERAAREDATRLDRWRDLMLGVLGHDLRGPLSTIRMTAELLSRLSSPARGHAQRILAAGDRMKLMIGQLLDMTRLKVDRSFPMEPREVDLAALCRQVIDEVSAAAPTATFQVDPSGDLRLLADPDRLFQVVANLVQNAVAHGTGPVWLRLHGAPDHVEVDVHNHGTPIPARLLPVLFDPFVRGEGRTASGLGIGLFISRRIVEGHRGTIEVRSTAERGTTFSIRLPRGG